MKFEGRGFPGQGFDRGSNDASENDADLKSVEQAYGGQQAWEKARAEGKTKLTYGQWLQVRTPKFKAWFGDWELVALERSMRRVRGSNKVQAIRGEIVDRPIVIMESGIVTTVSNSSLGKMMSQSNVDRSVSSQAHMQALGNIDRLFRLARLYETRNPKKATDVGDIAAIHHFEVPMPFDGEMLRVRMMGKQFIDPAKETRLYLLEALEIEKAGVKGGDPQVSGQFQHGTAATSPPAPGSRTSLSQMVSAINGDGVSKAIDPQTGEPMVVYHGTAADVEFFDPLALGAHTHAQSAKGGFFLAASPKVASGYAAEHCERLFDGT